MDTTMITLLAKTLPADQLATVLSAMITAEKESDVALAKAKKEAKAAKREEKAKLYTFDVDPALLARIRASQLEADKAYKAGNKSAYNDAAKLYGLATGWAMRNIAKTGKTSSEIMATLHDAPEHAAFTARKARANLIKKD